MYYVIFFTSLKLENCRKKGDKNMGFLEILTLIFITLKLFGVITWSWWLVLLPEIVAGVIYVLFIISAIKTKNKFEEKWM